MTEHRVLFESNEGRGTLTELAPGQSIPSHHHSQVRDTFVVVSGELAIDAGTPPVRRRLTPGETTQVDARTPHTVMNLGDRPVVFVLVQTNGPYDFIPA
jgi:quercetin dioxygenase-like cupin family protein